MVCICKVVSMVRMYYMLFYGDLRKSVSIILYRGDWNIQTIENNKIQSVSQTRQSQSTLHSSHLISFVVVVVIIIIRLLSLHLYLIIISVGLYALSLRFPTIFIPDKPICVLSFDSNANWCVCVCCLCMCPSDSKHFQYFHNHNRVHWHEQYPIERFL